ncbi:hypothetical protein NFI96_014999 [Prochilodus magdalenae]|nr:hypothetical protein NFI96_014999 [Prochilodus magdalenae]
MGTVFSKLEPGHAKLPSRNQSVTMNAEGMTEDPDDAMNSTPVPLKHEQAKKTSNTMENQKTGSTENCTSTSESSVNESASLNVVLFGNTSAVSFGDENILLGEEHLHPQQAKLPRRTEVSGRVVSVINLLDLQEGGMYLDPMEDITGQLLSENSIHSFIFVLHLGHFTDTDKVGLEWLQSKFGEGVLPFVMILFTYEREEECDTIIDDLKNNSVLEQLVQKCGSRYHTCSKNMNNQSEMKALLEKIDHMVSENNHCCYTAEMYNTTLLGKKQLQDSKSADKASDANPTINEASKVKTEEQTKKEDEEEKTKHGAAADPYEEDKVKHDTEQLFIKLNLKERIQHKMKTADVLQIIKPSSENDLVHTFLQRLLLMNYRARSGEESKIHQIHPVTENDGESDAFTDLFMTNKKEPVQTSVVHAMDVQMAVFHCSDPFLKQLIVTKLSQCQYALPLLVPNPFTRELEFPLWTFRQIRKSWKTTMGPTDSGAAAKTTSNEKAVATVDTPMVAFFRLGAVPSSKSQLMDSIINEKHNTFIHRHCPGSSPHRLLMDGVVEIAWYLPSAKDTDHFTECVAFCNLHGDAAAHVKQLEILTDMSSVNVVLVSNLNKDDERMKTLQKLYQLSKPMICLLSEESSHITLVKNGKYKMGLKDRNQSDLSAEIRNTIRELISKPFKTFRVEDVKKHSGLRVDEQTEDCRRGRDSAKQMTKFLEDKDITRIKEAHFPCQGRQWKNWCLKNKELHRPQGGSIELKKSKTRMEMKNIREQQNAQGLSDFMKLFTEKLNSKTPDERVFLIKWINIFLDNFTENISSLQHEYDQKWSKILNLKKSHDKSGKLKNEEEELEKMSRKMSDAAFGLEHVLREVGQIYESQVSVEKNKKETGRVKVSTFPRLAADLLISGYPLELMDGDTAHVPLIWVSAVLDEVRKTLGDRRVFVLSVLGIQSSGKSTMLNAMFGLQFAVSAGRCTKGAFMQLVKVSEEMKKEELKFDYILVVDTEGLRAPELAGMSTRHHDNELATFVIGLGNMTLINIFGENPTEMQDILQIVIQAFMRMKKVRLSPSCMFVHQNVGAVTAGEKNMEGRRRLQETLDEMTKLAAKEELSNAECFSDVITFDVESDVRYFAQLWEGSPPMAPPNPSYCECVQELKNAILKKASRIMTLSEFQTTVNDLWSALLHENFVFSFRNTLEIAAYRKLETEFGKWTWSLRSTMLETVDKLHHRILNGDIQVGEKDIVGNMKTTKEEVTKSMEQYLEKDKDTLIQWEGRFTRKIEDLYEELVREAKKKLDEVLEQRKTKEKLDERKTEYENKLFNLSKELALRLRNEETDEHVLKREFDSVWGKWVTDLTQNTQRIKDIDFWEDVTHILSERYELSTVYERLSQKAYEKLGSRGNFTEYIILNKNDMGVDEYKQPTPSWNIKQTLNYAGSALFKLVGNVTPQQTKQSKNDLYAEDNMSIRNMISGITEETDVLIKSVQALQLGYNSCQVQEITDFVQNAVQQHQTANRRYVLKKEFTVDLCLYVCRLAEPTFVGCHEKFTKTNDPKRYLENQKLQYYNVYRNFCQGATTAAIFGDLICSKLEPSILQAVYNQTAIDVAALMRSSSPAFSSNRSNLEKHILKSLAEEEDIEKYWEYIHNPKQHFRTFIAEQAAKFLNSENKQVQRIYKDNLKNKTVKITNAVCVATDEVKNSRGNASMWLRRFSTTLIDELNFPEISCVDHMEAIDFNFLNEIINEGLTKMMSKLHGAGIQLEAFQERAVEILTEHLSQCCWEQCPFCNAICTGTMKDHDGEHCVPFHRSKAITGTHYIHTEILNFDFCTTAVQSDKRFYPDPDSDETVPYKQYRTAGGRFATWNITPDCSELPYWKWFVCRFQKDVENHYVIQVITDYNSKVSTPVTTDAALPAELNNFYARFETPAQAQSCNTALLPTTEEETPLILAADEVRRALMRVSTRKAAGPDGIPGRVLKACASQLASTFTDIFNLSLAQSTVPVCFKTTTIIPIPTPSSQSQLHHPSPKSIIPIPNPSSQSQLHHPSPKSIITCMEDYRPIALTPIVMKCSERLTLSYIKRSLPSTLDPHQFAYRANRSTDDASPWQSTPHSTTWRAPTHM